MSGELHRRDETVPVVGHVQLASGRGLLGSLARSPAALFPGQDVAQGRRATLTLGVAVGDVRAELAGAGFEDQALEARLSAVDAGLYGWWWAYVDAVAAWLAAHVGRMPSPGVAWRVARYELVVRNSAKARAAVEDGLALVEAAGATADEVLEGEELAEVLDLLGQVGLADRVRDALADV